MIVGYLQHEKDFFSISSITGNLTGRPTIRTHIHFNFPFRYILNFYFIVLNGSSDVLMKNYIF